MALVATWDGTGLADGTAVDTTTAAPGTNPFTTVTAGAFTIDGGRLRMDQQASTVAQAVWTSNVLGVLTAYAVRFYLELSAWPSAGAPIMQAYGTGNTALRWRLDVTAAGQLRLRDAANTVLDTAAAGLTVGDEVRVDVVVNGTAATVTVHQGDDTGTPLATLSGTVGSGMDALRPGNPQTAPTWPRLWLAELAVSGVAAAIGPPPEQVPRFPLQDRYELLLDGTWTDITQWVYERDPVTITRGRSAEAQDADPCSLTATLDNRDGRFSARNPLSPWYGILGRNTRLRASLPAASGYLRVWSYAAPGAAVVSTPDASKWGVTDLDIRVEADADAWTNANAAVLATRYETTGNQRSWMLETIDQKLALGWSTDGTLAGRVVVESTAKPPPFGRLAVRATLDVNNGAGGHTIRFYTAPSIAGPWTQLGDPIVRSGTMSIFDGTAGLKIGANTGIVNDVVSGRYYKAELRDGIDGALIADPDFTAQTRGAGSFTDSQGNVWTLGAGVELDDRDYRFYGEVASWPATWSVDGVDNYVKIQAAGIKRRLTQNAPPARSPMYREFASPARTHILAYWPCEDGEVSQQIAAAGNRAAPMSIAGSPTLASYSDWTASDPLPVMASGTFTGVVPTYADTGQISVRMFVFVNGNIADERSLLHVVTAGTVARWDVRLTAGGALRTRAFDPAGTSLLDSTASFAMASRGFTILDLELSQSGANINWATKVIDFVNTQTINDSPDVATDSGTVTGQTLGPAQIVTVGGEQGLTTVVVGHITVADALTAYANTTAAIAAQNGENPTNRMARLCAEQQVAFARITKGQTDGNVVALGDQLDKTFVELLEEAADTDLGILVEPRDFLGFAYRSRLSLYDQAAAVTLDYSGRQVAGDLTPVDDDQATQNDLTVKRDGGSSYRVEQTTGPLSTDDPPDGVGRYATETTVSLSTDAQLVDQAGWRLHLGTVDEPRFPTLEVNLRAPAITDDLAADILALDVGDRIVVTGMPEGLPREDVTQIVQGYTETLRVMEHTIVFNLEPESPWHVGVVEDDGDDFDRIDTAGAEVVEDAADDAGTFVVASTAGPYWTASDDDLPVDVMAAGERVTVTAVADAVNDGFDRTESSGWGSSPDGRAWTPVDAASSYSVASSIAVMSTSAANQGRLMTLDLTTPAADIEAQWRTRAVPTGASVNYYLLTHTDGTSWYALRIQLYTDKTIGLAITSGAPDFATLAAEKTIYGLTVAADVWHRARFSVADGWLRGKVWPQGQPEPNWQVAAPIPDPQAEPDKVGLRFFRNSGNTNAGAMTAEWAEFIVHNPQALTVTRSVNDVVKDQAAGAAVTIANPAYVAL